MKSKGYRWAALRRAVILVLVILFGAAPLVSQGPASSEEDLPCGIAPRAKPRRIKGGEGIPPLPLPATPLRRSERKRDPTPPLLIGKMRWGRRNLVWKLPDGREVRYADL